ncbi:MAG: BspA family leucine-rich repeat surface protein [Cytophagales bacterium]|nr:BspA family leucine-rich repeat surface protein [Cytophagales bacterium]
MDVTGNITHTYATPGTYTVSISGAFPRIYFNDPSFFFTKDSRKILSVEQWGSTAWTSMASAFAGCVNLRINAPDNPNLSGVTDMSRMFYRASAMNDDVNAWNVSTVTNMAELFADAEAFNQPLNAWNVSSVTNMSEMFGFARAFNQDISGWNVSNVTNMAGMFAGATIFNQNIGGWDVINVTSLSGTFSFATSFNQNISGWKVGNVTDMSGLFNNAIAFNQDISGWNISSVLYMSRMFSGAIAFTNDITGWNVINVTQMNGMFSDHPTFNQDITGWTVDNVNDMGAMFENTTMFNQDISGWDVSKVRDFNSMFDGATAFNQPIGTWTLNTVSTIDMRGMFDGASSFDQDLSSWDVSQLTQAFNMLNNSGLSVTHYDNLLEGWASQTLKSNVQFGASNLFYCTGETARANLISTFNWFITDGGQKCISLFNGPTTAAPEILNAQALAIDFGSIDILPSIKTRSFTLVNNQSIGINNVVVAITGSGFSTASAPALIAPGAAFTFTVDLSAVVASTFLETVLSPVIILVETFHI